MKKMLSIFVLVILTLVSIISYSRPAHADDVKMVGTISKIVLAADKKSATAVLKDSKSGEEVTILVNDELTLDKFMDKRIVEGDEVRCKFEKVDGKNTSKMFKKTAGC
jgi:hypothetical protein